MQGGTQRTTQSALHMHGSAPTSPTRLTTVRVSYIEHQRRDKCFQSDVVSLHHAICHICTNLPASSCWNSVSILIRPDRIRPDPSLVSGRDTSTLFKPPTSRLFCLLVSRLLYADEYASSPWPWNVTGEHCRLCSCQCACALLQCFLHALRIVDAPLG